MRGLVRLRQKVWLCPAYKTCPGPDYFQNKNWPKVQQEGKRGKKMKQKRKGTTLFLMRRIKRWVKLEVGCVKQDMNGGQVVPRQSYSTNYTYYPVSCKTKLFEWAANNKLLHCQNSVLPHSAETGLKVQSRAVLILLLHFNTIKIFQP